MLIGNCCIPMAAMRFIPSPSSEMFQSSDDAVRNNNLQTTPKLPKRERLASFSRLIASENLKELRPEPMENRKNIKRSCKKLIWNSENVPDIRISSSSPASTYNKSDAISRIKEPGSFGFLSLPFSPKINMSPKYESPTYQQPTPVRSPLYISDPKGVFLGRGSFGNVTLCTYKGSKFALKIIHDKESFIGERNFINIRHPHLVSVLHMANVLDKVFICMEFAGHCNLQQVLDTKSELDFHRRLSFTIQIALGLRHCHQRRIVHGDVKPANVIVNPYGICKLGDFGQSINLDSADSVIQNNNVIGTVAYAAPEVLRGNQPTLFSDIYSFGILLWQVQSRELPFAGEHPHVVIYKVAHYGLRPQFQSSFNYAFENTAKSCWLEEPNQRPNISEVLQKLQDIKTNVKRNVTK